MGEAAGRRPPQDPDRPLLHGARIVFRGDHGGVDGLRTRTSASVRIRLRRGSTASGWFSGATATHGRRHAPDGSRQSSPARGIACCAGRRSGETMRDPGRINDDGSPCACRVASCAGLPLVRGGPELRVAAVGRRLLGEPAGGPRRLFRQRDRRGADAAPGHGRGVHPRRFVGVGQRAVADVDGSGRAGEERVSPRGGEFPASATFVFGEDALSIGFRGRVKLFFRQIGNGFTAVRGSA